MVQTWAFSNKAIPQGWAKLISAVLERGHQLLWRCFFKEEVRILEQQKKANGLEMPLDQILGEGPYSDPKDQALYDDYTLKLDYTSCQLK